MRFRSSTHRCRMARSAGRRALDDTFWELGIEVHDQITEGIRGDVRHNPKVKNLVGTVGWLRQFIKDEELESKVIKKRPVPLHGPKQVSAEQLLPCPGQEERFRSTREIVNPR